jgi:arylsulfatase A-like enzyme
VSAPPAWPLRIGPVETALRFTIRTPKGMEKLRHKPAVNRKSTRSLCGNGFKYADFMSLRITAALLSCGFLCLGSLVPALGSIKIDPPNIIFILADDLGWTELGCYGNRFNETPNLDRMAGQGMRFMQAYASGPVCSPTRAAFLTGRSPASLGLTDYLKPDDEKFLSPNCPTINKQLKQAGYVSGLVGKWHLNGDYARHRGTPAQHGFDEVICSEEAGIGAGDYWHPYKFMTNVAPKLPNVAVLPLLHQMEERVGERRRGSIENSPLLNPTYELGGKGGAKDVRTPNAAATSGRPGVPRSVWSAGGFSTAVEPFQPGRSNGFRGTNRGFSRAVESLPARSSRGEEVSSQSLENASEYLTDRLNLEAIEFIERHKAQPFFLYLAHYAPHQMLDAKPDKLEKFQAKPNAGKNKSNPKLAAMLESIDDGVGLIMKKLDELKLADNTVLIFMSDNGGERSVTDNFPLRAGKSFVYEGGLRVPCIVRWPGHTKPDAVCDIPIITHDLYPTFMEIAGVKPDRAQGVEGKSLASLFHGASQLKRDTLYWHYPLAKPHFLGGSSASAIRKGDFKLIECLDSGKVELYDLKNDLSEARDLSAAMPRKTVELRKQLADWRKTFGHEKAQKAQR